MNDIHNYIYWEDDAPEIDVPEDFFSKRWPHPRRRNNAPPRADKALRLFMEGYRDFVLDEDDLDILNIPDNARWRNVWVKVKAKFNCYDCNKTWSSNNGSIEFDMKEKTVQRM